MLSTPPSPGQIVRARARAWLVESTTPPPQAGHATVVRLACIEDDALGESLEVLWEHEVDAELAAPSTWARAAERGFDRPELFAAYLHTQRWSCVTATNPKLFQAPYRAGIEVMAYQLEPLRKALLLPYVNLFIADDVGLGKTIEAGIVLRELMMRQKVRRVVVACPPSVVLQWQAELEQRFGLRFVVYDREYLREKRKERGFGVNPFTTHTRFIVSHALLRDETHASLLRDWITNDDHLRPEFREPALFVLDEAHHAAPASGARYAIDSRLTKVVRELAQLFEHRLFLSATPHNGHTNSFSALLEILDPARFCRGVKASPKHLDAVMVRRLKSDLRAQGQGFPVRRVIQLDLDGLPDDAPELTLARLLDEYRALREARVADATKRAQSAALLVIIALQKRLLSSIDAFARTLAVHERGVLRAQAQRRAAAPVELQLTLLDPPGADDEDDASEDELRERDEAEVERAAEAAVAAADPDARERELLAQMRAIAEDARDRPDARATALIEWIRAHCLEPDGRTWRDRRVLVFTEYADTKSWLVDQLGRALANTQHAGARIATFHGGMVDEAREEVKRAFNLDPRSHPLRILVATDAAREGVNLQNHCADLFHFDVPWNPSRMEQRNGRIDRKLQREAEVRCHYFVLTQRPEDAVLAALVEKTRRIHDELGSLSQVLEARVSRLLEGGIRRRDVAALAGAVSAEAVDGDRARTVREELEQGARSTALDAQTAVLQDMLATAKEHLDLRDDAFREALSASLEVLGAPPLRPSPDHPGAFEVPVDHPRLGNDPAWTETLDALRAPRARGEKIWEWRKSSPIRPVVFRDTGSLDEHFVHLHLEHRLVQRLLGRFLAQGFVHDDLARACAVVSDDPIPRVVLLGRLSLHGEAAARLHDEIVAVAARWSPSTRTGALEPYAHEAKAKTLSLVEDALRGPRRPDPQVEERLRASVMRDVDDLRPHLAKLAAERAARAVELLRQRADREAKEMTDVLAAQRDRLEAQLGETDDAQLLFKFDTEEKKQRDADRRHWQKRLGAIASDLEAEPARIRRVYEVRAERIEPLGVVYLVPRTG